MGVICRKPRFRAGGVGGGYQWFKIVGATQNNGSGIYAIDVAEIRINDILPSQAFAGSTTSPYSAAKAIDDNVSTYWISGQGSSPDTTWLAVKMTGMTLLSKIKMYPATPYPHLFFNNFALYGSNDSTNGSDGTWTLIASGLTRSDDDVRWHEWTF